MRVYKLEVVGRGRVVLTRPEQIAEYVHEDLSRGTRIVVTIDEMPAEVYEALPPCEDLVWKKLGKEGSS